MLEIKEIKPIGSQVLVTKNLYGWDDIDASNIVIHAKGELKSYQQVIAIGDDVRFVQPGDLVEINFYKYCKFENDENSVKVNGSNKVVSLMLNEVDMVDTEGDPIVCFLIDQRDIKYILKDYKEVTYDKDDSLIVIKPPKKQLILPNNKIQV